MIIGSEPNILPHRDLGPASQLKKLLMDSIPEYQTLIDEFQQLPKSPRNPTFMQVAGYSHYENVCSNLLAFFLNPQEEHQLGDIVLRALLDSAGFSEIGPLESVRIYREFTTFLGQRIDLVIKSDGLVVGVENKIYHWVANDLSHYADSLDKLGEPGSRVVKIVLGLEHINEPLAGNFRSVTYLQLWGAVEPRLGGKLAQANQKWICYLSDFIQTTRSLSQKNMELLPNDKFFIKNNQAITNLIEEHERFIARTHERVQRLFDMIASHEKWHSLELFQEPWKAGRHCIVFDFMFGSTRRIAIDFCLFPTGWEMQLFSRESGSDFLELLMKQEAMQGYANAEVNEIGRKLIHRWPISTDLEEIESLAFNAVQILSKTGKLLTHST